MPRAAAGRLSRARGAGRREPAAALRYDEHGDPAGLFPLGGARAAAALWLANRAPAHKCSLNQGLSRRQPKSTQSQNRRKI